LAFAVCLGVFPHWWLLDLAIATVPLIAAFPLSRTQKAGPVSTLTIDQQGVHLKRAGALIEFLWKDIESARTIQVDKYASNYPTFKVYIKRRGEITQIEDSSELIGAEFRVSFEELISVIHEGVDRWGGLNTPVNQARD
jgi:hypothetical protein